MARVSGTALSNFFKLYQKMGEPVGKAVRGVGQELAEQGIHQAAKNVITGKVAGKSDEEVAKAFIFDPGVELSEIVESINAVGASASDLVAILEALREAGSLRAELIII